MRDPIEEHVAIDPGSKWPLIMLIPALAVAAYLLVRHVDAQRTNPDMSDVAKRDSARAAIKLLGKPCIDVCALASVGTSDTPILRVTCSIDWSAPPCKATRAYLMTAK